MDPQIDEQVAKLLSGLKKVEAPQNFESRVLSRLATTPVENNSFGFLKLALPTAGLAAIALFLFLSGYLGGDMPTVNVVSSENEKANTPLQKLVPQEQTVSRNNDQQPSSELRAPEVAGTKPEVRPSQPPSLPGSSSNSPKNRRRQSGGSQDFGSGDGGRTSAPGIDTNSRPGTDADMERMMRRASIPAADVLRYTGVAAEFRGSGWTVKSVTQNSVAERVGLKAGDVILYLNDIRIGKDTAFPSGVDIRMTRVSRGGKTFDLKF